MSQQALSPLRGASARADHVAPPRPTPHRPVLSLAMAIFLPAMWLVLNGNLSVQTALIRFIGALLVSWVAARIVLATVNSHNRSTSVAIIAGDEPAAPEADSARPAGGPDESSLPVG